MLGRLALRCLVAAAALLNTGGMPGRSWQHKPPIPADDPCRSLVTRQEMIGHDDSVNCLHVMPQRPLLISGSDDGSARMWDLRTLQCVLGFEARLRQDDKPGPVSSVAVSETHEHFLYAASGPAVLLFDLRMPAVQRPVQVMVQETAVSGQSLWGHDISQISMHPSGSHLAAVDEGGFVSIIDLGHSNSNGGKQHITKLAAKHTTLASSICWRSPIPEFHQHLFTGGFDMKVLMHRLRPGGVAPLPGAMLEAQTESLDMHEPQRAARSYSRRASSGTARGGKRSSHAPAAEDGGAEDPGSDNSGMMINPPFVHAISSSLDGRTLAAACGDGSLRTYALDAEGHLEQFGERRYQRHRQRATCLAFPRLSPQSRCFTGSDDGRVLVWNLGEPAYEKADPLILDVPHGRMPNWIYCSSIGSRISLTLSREYLQPLGAHRTKVFRGTN